MTTIKLTVKETAYNNKIFYLTGISEVNKNLLIKHKEANTLKNASDIIGINCINILKLGETKEASPYSISEYVGFFYGAITDDKPKFNNNRPQQYRNYAKSEQEQDKLRHLVDLDLSEIASAKSALNVIKEEFCCLWWDYNYVSYDSK